MVKELVARSVDSSNDLHFKSQTYITNARLALLQGNIYFCEGNCGTMPGCETIATFVEALLGAGELHLGGRHTQSVVIQIMHFLDTRQWNKFLWAHMCIAPGVIQSLCNRRCVTNAVWHRVH